MPMAIRRLGPGTLTLRAMFSPEPLTITNGRYPLLFQEGEHVMSLVLAEKPSWNETLSGWSWARCCVLS